MQIGKLNSTDSIIVIAEIGNNHEGDRAVAEQMIVAAANAGVDAVKFQTFRTELFINPEDRVRFQRFKRFELTFDDFAYLAEVASRQGVEFLSTPFDLESADFLNSIVPAFKIGSCENTFYPLLEQLASFGKPIILSSGLVSLEDLRRSLEVIYRLWHSCSIDSEVAVLHCITSYPTDPKDANLLALNTLRSELDCTIGYSDHTVGIEAIIAAAALGARLIEKHFTLDKNFSDFRDHQLSTDPQEMAEAVRSIRAVEVLLGQPGKCVAECEREIEMAVRRSIVAKHAISAGSLVSESDITWTRPGGGFSPGEELRVVGKRASLNIAQGSIITSGMLD